MARYFDKQGINYIVYDDYIPEYKYDIALPAVTIAVKSGGVTPNHRLVRACRDLNREVVSDLELFYRFSPPKKMIVITGTNGKTTTAALTAHLIGDIDLGGNIGPPLFDFIDTKRDIVIEASSFMLADCRQFHPNIAVFLNLTPHHLAYHSTFVEYVKAKMHLIKNLNNSDIIIYNYDDPLLKRLLGAIPETFPFSLREEVNGIYLKNNVIYYRQQRLINTNMLPLPGKHNIANTMAALAAAISYDTNLTALGSKLAAFQAAPYRLEYLGSIKGVKYYNDSKATNLAAMAAALNTFSDEKLVLLCGGVPETADYKILDNSLANLNRVIVNGDNRDCFSRYFQKKNVPVIVFPNLKAALENLLAYTNNATVVLFSPGAASYDQFRNYQERGQCFNNWFNRQKQITKERKGCL